MAATKIDVSQIDSSEFGRTWSAEILFDKKEIEYEEHELAGDLTYSVAITGHLTNQFCAAVQRVITDGTRTVDFSGFDFVLGDIQSGSVPDAGTYLVLFLHWNGVNIVNWTEPSLEIANLTPLAAPANFEAVADGEDEIDLSWDNVTNNAGYQIDYSADGISGWTTLITLAADVVSYSNTGLSASTQRFYRIRALGDMIVFSNSGYSTANATTEDGGDVTAPTFIFEIIGVPGTVTADAATDIPLNAQVRITASEALIDDDGTTVITDANVDDYLVVKVDNGAGANIPYTATIDASKTVITITPNVVWPTTDNVFIQIDGVEDVNGNESTADDATFTTNDYTIMNVNFLNLGTQFDSFITAANADFELEYEFKDAVFLGSRGLWQKDNGSTQRSFIWATDDDDVKFHIINGTSVRTLVWTGALTGVTSGKITLKYFGAVDTNNGLDRATLFLDDVLVGSKSLIASGPLSWPFDMATSTAPLYISGPTFREVKNAFIRNNTGGTVQGQYPIIRTGEDTSGNNRDGTWV